MECFGETASQRSLSPRGIRGTICREIAGARGTVRGNAAAKPIMYRLPDRGRARAIAAEVVTFYGDYLQYHESSILPSSLFEIKMQHDPIKLKYARIGLRLGTGRTAEALSHELLHLRLGILGYSMGEEVRVPYELIPYAGHLMGIHAIVVNLLHHELIFEAFLDLGFKEHRFLARPEPPPDYEALAQSLLISPDYAAELGFPWWCLEYFRHWLSMRHGHGEQSGVYANNAIRWASQLHPEIAETTQDMRRIVESGMLRNVREYPILANRLLELMRMPIYTKWVNLKAPAAAKAQVLSADIL